LNTWGRETYGDPCTRCGYTWSLNGAEAAAIVSGSPAAFIALLDGRAGTERLHGLDWSAQAYVLHVADNLRIWSERLAVAGLGSGGAHDTVAGYDQDALARARNYEAMNLPSALWSIQRAVGDWTAAVHTVAGGGSGPEDIVMVHAEMGAFTLDDVTRQVAHDAFHHLDDVRRILAAAG
jgi:hypothetical protein